MKKQMLILPALLAVFAVLFAVFAFAAEEFGANIPEDAFDGGYTEYKGKDGSVTRVFDNGSVSTKNKDGSVTAVDYKGNRYDEAKDGSSTVRTTDGYTAKEYKDGRTSLTEPDGKTTTFNTDGSFSESYNIGLTLDYNADGDLKGIGFTDGNQRIETDENGYYKNGEIKGPNGQKLVITDDGMKYINAEGTAYDHTDLGSKQTSSIQWKDGATFDQTTTVSWQDGKKVENTDAVLIESDGGRWDTNINTSYDENGNPVTINNHVTQWTGSDGSTLWMDNNSKAAEFRGADGSVLIVDQNGNLRENKSDEVDFKAVYDEYGNLVSSDITYKDGAHLTQNPDGTASFTLPDGTKYTSDGGGNVWMDGVQIKQDGKWLNTGEPGEITPADVVGTWRVEATFSNIDSPLVGMLQGFFDQIFGEGAGDDIVSDGVRTSSATQTVVIESTGGDTLRVTIYSGDTTMIYTGSLKKSGELPLKLVSQSSGEDGDAVEIPLDNIAYTFVHRGNEVVLDGSCHIDTFFLKADLRSVGRKQ